MKFFLFIYFATVTGLTILFFQDKELEESIQRGSEIYQDFCITCHQGTGEGVANTFPPLAGSDYLLTYREESIRGIKYGQQGELMVNGVTYNNTMPPMGLEEEEIADVMNFILNSWGNASDEIVTSKEVELISED
ncbi:c-type cytochrome [Ulvibacterium marinum]|uniref:c-type cytochrome n=1 Tax=Ulvibacterium marinum TaxID=2419782 RepID=UPI002494CA9B|nr:cytochrome c [Ulvibacterium marinum]